MQRRQRQHRTTETATIKDITFAARRCIVNLIISIAAVDVQFFLQLLAKYFMRNQKQFSYEGKEI